MINVYVKSGEAINLGREGTKGVRRVIFDFTRWAREYGEGSVQLVVMRHGDTSPYPVALTVDGEEAVWEVGAADTAIPGEGECEWQYFVGDALEKSEVYKTFVENAMGEAANEAPEAAQGWVEQVLEAAAKVETAIKKAPIIFADTWWIWDADAEEYVDTGVNAKGKNGESITIANITESEASGGANIVTFSDGKTLTVKNGKDGEDGYTPVKGKDYFDGKDGYTPQKGVDYFDGKDGKTPVKGEDYFTAEDKAEIVEQVIEEMPEPSGGLEITNTAAVGQTVKITAIDADGKPTEWEAVDFPEGGAAIVDVVELPTENIDEDVFYRVVSGGFLWEDSPWPDYSVICVEQLPETGEAVTTDMQTAIFYYSVADGGVYGYITEALSQATGLPVGWLSAETLAPAFGAAYGGVVNDIAEASATQTLYVLIEYVLWDYKGKWSRVKVGKPGEGKDSAVFGLGKAPGRSAVSIGYAQSIGDFALATGESVAAGPVSFSMGGEGTRTEEAASCGVAIGSFAISRKMGAVAIGDFVIAGSEWQCVQGKGNIVDSENKYAQIVGNGDDANRSNAHTLDWDGVGWYAGGLKVGGTGQDDAEAQDVMLAPLTAKAGQTIVVKEVDENGKPLSWEPVDNVTSWNDLTDKPFGEEQAFEPIEWDGDMTGKFVLNLGGASLVKVSDEVYTAEELVGATMTGMNIVTGETQNIIISEDEINPSGIPGSTAIGDGFVVVIYSAEELIATIGEAAAGTTNGVYFIYAPETFYVFRLTAPSVVKTLDPKFLPTLTSPNGTKFKLTVDDSGTISATEVT